MPTRETDSQGVGAAVKQVAERTSAIVRLELELAALALVMPTWAALLVVAGILFLKVAVLGLLAVNRIKKGTPPVPEQAIREAKLTTEALKSNGR